MTGSAHDAEEAHLASRYDRQVRLPDIGTEGQDRIRESIAMVVGCGALGTGILNHLARAGVGRLIIIDRDVVEPSNLQRQSLFDERDALEGRSKAGAAAKRISEINRDIEVVAIDEDLAPGNFAAVAESFDCLPTMLIDGLDNFDTRLLMNDYAIRESIPYVYGAAVGWTGGCMAVLPPGLEDRPAPWDRTNCLRCIFAEGPPPGLNQTCDTAGVAGPAVGVVASYQAAEALKIAVGNWPKVERNLWSFDLLQGTATSLKVDGLHRNNQCPACIGRRFEWLEGDRYPASVRLCGQNAVQIELGSPLESQDFDQIEQRIQGLGSVRRDARVCRIEIEHNDEPVSFILFPRGRVLIRGVHDVEQGRSLCTRFLGL